MYLKIIYSFDFEGGEYILAGWLLFLAICLYLVDFRYGGI